MVYVVVDYSYHAKICLYFLISLTLCSYMMHLYLGYLSSFLYNRESGW